MPWIDILIPLNAEQNTQERVKEGLARIMEEVVQKEEKGLYVTFTEAKGFYRAGTACLDGAVVDVRYIGSFPLEKKRELTKRICALLAKELGTDPQKVYITFSELTSENWGRRAGEYS